MVALGRLWGLPGGVLHPLGRPWGSPGCPRGAPGGVLGHSWAPPGALLDALGALLDALDGRLASPGGEGSDLGAFFQEDRAPAAPNTAKCTSAGVAKRPNTPRRPGHLPRRGGQRVERAPAKWTETGQNFCICDICDQAPFQLNDVSTKKETYYCNSSLMINSN